MYIKRLNTLWHILGNNFSFIPKKIKTVPDISLICDFTVVPQSGVHPLDVQFTDTSIGTVTSRLWTFGTGEGTSTAQNPTHQYTTPGSYTVSLTVTGPGGIKNKVVPFMITANYIIPVPAFSGTPLSGDYPLDVDFTDASTGDITGRLWHFGTGEGTSTATNPSHQYDTAGTFDVKLTASNPESSVDENKVGYVEVTIPLPVAAFTQDAVSGDYPKTIAFTNQSTYSGAQGVITDWLWSFGAGEGTSTAQNPTHQYTTAGTFTVSLKVTNARGDDTETKTNLITITIPLPVADFTFDLTSGDYPLTITPTDLSTYSGAQGVITGWDWDWGDGTAHGTTATPGTHIYTTAASFTPILTVTNARGTNAKTRTNYVTTAIPLPVADFTFSAVSGNYPLTITPTDASTYTGAQAAITAWSWVWGDSTANGSGAAPGNHTYNIPGTFTASLMVTNARGTNTKTRTNYVTASVPAIPGNPELEFYLETTACRTVVTGSPNRLSHILDLGGAHDFIQGTSANRPEYDTTTPTPLSPNGKQGAHFNGDYVLEDNGGSNTYIDQNAGQFIAMVVGNLSADDDTLFAKWNGSTDDRRFELMTNLYNVSKRSTAYVENASALFTRPTGAFRIIIARWEPGVYTKVWIDNVLAGTAVTPTTATLPDTVNCEDRIGSRGDGFSLTTGDLYALVNYRDAGSDQDMNDVYWNLYNRYKL